jgi:hypothetical protein
LIVPFLEPACIPGLHPSYEYDQVTKKRSTDQVNFQDSLNVFFVEDVNPYPDKEVLWFSSFLEGPVEMEIYDAASDSLEAVFTFEPQSIPLYTVAYRAESSRLVKCVIRVNDQPKCARLLPAFYPIPQPQWGTKYTVQEKHGAGE